MSIAQIVTRGIGIFGSPAGIVTAGFIASTSDTIPDAFFFNPVLNASISTIYTSNTITITGIDVPVPYSVTGGLVSKNGGAFSSSSGTCVVDDKFTLQLVSSPIGGVPVSAALTVSSVTGTYSVTTAAVSSNTYNWTLIRERICDRVLMKCGRLGAGDTAEYDDRALVIEALESVLKNLAWRGYAWPREAPASTSLSLTANTSSTPLPTDFYKENALNVVYDNGDERELTLIDFPTYKRITNKAQSARYPFLGYIDNFNVLWTYPVQDQNTIVKLYYQKIIADTTQAQSTELDSPWMLGLIYGVACEVGDEFGVPAQKMARFEGKWAQQLQLGVMNEAPPAPDRVLMDD